MGPEGWGPKGGAPKGGAPKGRAPKGGAPKGGAPKGGAPKGGGPKISRFFFPFPPPFRSICVCLGVCLWNFGGVFGPSLSDRLWPNRLWPKLRFLMFEINCLDFF